MHVRIAIVFIWLLATGCTASGLLNDTSRKGGFACDCAADCADISLEHKCEFDVDREHEHKQEKIDIEAP
jgi:hypothetical protein